MKKSFVVRKAKSAYRLAQLLGISKQAVSKWGADVPQKRADMLMRNFPEWFVKKEK